MTRFRQTLHLWGIWKVSVQWVKRQSIQRNEEALLFALHHGRYDVRACVAEHLLSFESKQALESLVAAMDDSVELVSQSAMRSLEKMIIDEALNLRIEEKRSWWIAHRAELEERQRHDKHYVPDRKERPSKKSFDNLKKMLMKPMNTGKWF